MVMIGAITPDFTLIRTHWTEAHALPANAARTLRLASSRGWFDASGVILLYPVGLIWFVFCMNAAYGDRSLAVGCNRPVGCQQAQADVTAVTSKN